MEGKRKEAEARLIISKSSSSSKIQLSLIYIRNHDEIKNCHGSPASVAHWLELTYELVGGHSLIPIRSHARIIGLIPSVGPAGGGYLSLPLLSEEKNVMVKLTLIKL